MSQGIKEAHTESRPTTQNTLKCPRCRKQPALDVQHDWDGEHFPLYQFVCWLDNIFGRASMVIAHATDSWNDAAIAEHKEIRRAKLFRIGRRLQAVVRRGEPTPERAEWFFRNFLRFERVGAGKHPFHPVNASSVLDGVSAGNGSYSTFQTETGKVRAL